MESKIEELNDMAKNPDFSMLIDIIDNSKKMEALRFRIERTDVIRQEILRDTLIVLLDSYMTLENQAIRELRQAQNTISRVKEICDAAKSLDEVDAKASHALDKVQKQDNYILKQFEYIVMMLNNDVEKRNEI